MNRTQKRQALREARRASVNTAAQKRAVLFTSGGKYKKGSYAGTETYQVGLPLLPRKDKRDRFVSIKLPTGTLYKRVQKLGRITGMVTSPIRRAA